MQLRWLFTSSAMLWMLCVATASTETREPIVHALDVQAPIAPVFVPIAGRNHLVYELHLTNFAAADAVLTRVDVLDTASGRMLAEYGRADLATRIEQIGAKREGGSEVLGEGRRAVLFMWLPLDSSASPPAALEHRISFDLRTAAPLSAVVRAATTRPASETVAVLRSPVRGGPWVALYDPAMARGHRRFVYAVDGKARIPARFAIDLVRLGRDASVARGDSSWIANWYGYAAEVLAVADGVVVTAVDDMPESESIQQSQGPMPLEAASGNHVILDLGRGRYAVYEHLKHGSVRVRDGERVKAGQVLALLGNSGSSPSGPHLHFHVADAPSTLAAEGMPFVFETFEVIGQFERIGDFMTGHGWASVSPERGGTRMREYPDANAVVVFE